MRIDFVYFRPEKVSHWSFLMFLVYSIYILISMIVDANEFSLNMYKKHYSPVPYSEAFIEISLVAFVPALTASIIWGIVLQGLVLVGSHIIRLVRSNKM